MYTANQIFSFRDQWRSLYDENDEIGQACICYASGNQWEDDVRASRAVRGEGSLKFNVVHQHLLRAKGDGESLDFSLAIKGENLDGKLLKEARHILRRIVLHSDHLEAFREALAQVYDFGYSAVLVSSKQQGEEIPFEIPSLATFKDPTKVFFDPQCTSDYKTDGRFCGISYKSTRGELDVGGPPGKECDVVDFWYREPSWQTMYLDGKMEWSKEKPSKNFLAKKRVKMHSVKFVRVVDDEIKVGPIDYYTKTKLPIVYWKGVEYYNPGDTSRPTLTVPYIWNLMDAQKLVNYVGSALLGRIKLLGGNRIIIASDAIEGKTDMWQNFNSGSGVFTVNELENGVSPPPLVVPADNIDPNLINSMQISMQLMDQIAGVNAAQQGEANQVNTSGGLHRQIMQGNLLQKVILRNHLRATNEVGRVLKELVPNVIIEERNIGEGLIVNKRGKRYSPSNLEMEYDIKKIFSKVDFSIEFGPSSEAEKASNLNAVKELLSTNQQLAPYFLDEFVDNLNTANGDVLKRRVAVLMDPDIRKVGDGELSEEEFHQKKQQEAEQQQQQPSFEQQQLELEKQKIEGDQQLKQADLQLKAKKLENQGVKDTENLKIKGITALSKLSGGKNANS